MKLQRLAISTLLVLSCASPSLAEVTLPAMFSDHMVLQRDRPVKLWGWAEPGESVTGTVGRQVFNATADNDGRWSAMLKPTPAGGPISMTVRGKGGTININDVYYGEVWLCSGQSNMAMIVNRVRDAEQESASAEFPRIRMFKVDSAHDTSPQTKCEGTWSVCSPESIGRFSATAYFFGRKLHKELGVPIGLINSSVGGTSIESWTSMPTQLSEARVKPVLDAWKKADREFNPEQAKKRYERQLARWQAQRAAAKAKGKTPPRRPRMSSQPRLDRNHPSNLFNGKIQPLVGYSIRGAIWYQGENNAGRGLAHLYGAQLETLIRDWRQRWDQGDFPFAWVQLPNYRAAQQQPSETSGWVLVREGMLETLAVPNTGMAITVDIGEAGDIHPKNKQDVGKRLAIWALGDVYARGGETSGPIYRSASSKGNRMIVEFDHMGGGLVAKGDALKGFAVAGKDRQFHRANGRIEGNRVVVWSDDVAEPASVRYGWAANPDCNLFNKAGLPASPFRSDDWDETANQ